MKLTKLSRNRMMESATRWTVPREYFDPLFNYLVYGFEPGSFWSAVLANDFWRAVQSSHPSNDIPALKHVVGWIRDSFPPESYGSYEQLQEWIRLSPHTRRMILEQHELIYTEQEEIMMGLKGVQPVPEPVLW
jgi:hypothetical protein